MRERTPSADDTPTRAPPAPSREGVSADVAGSETSNDDTVEGYRTAKLSGIPSSSDRMVASTQSLEDLGVNHPANAAGSNADHQQHHQQQQQLQERYGHAYRSTQTAQDKRSRLSNVINNLRKKVPDGAASGNSDSPRKEEDDRNSVERNLETLEKYVMTVLNGVIKDDEEDKNAEKMKELERQRKNADEEEEEEEEEDRTDTAVKSDPSSEGDIEAAVVPRLEDSSTIENVEDVESSETTDCSNIKGTTEESLQDLEIRISQDLKEPLTRMEEERLDVEEKKSFEDDQSVSREKKESRTLGTIIMDRLSEHQVEEKANVDDGRGNRTHDEQVVSENTEVQTMCGELLNDLLSDVYRTIEDRENQQKVDEKSKKKIVDATESRVEETKDSSINVQELSMTGLHCSLPLDKVASVLQNCQTNESVTSRLSSGSLSSLPSAQKSKPSSSNPPVRLLCLYCDRKFLSMSLRQRHTERAHQLGGGRRSERNLRKPSQNCQYCSEKCADTLEALFQHMIGSHGDKYHACVHCSTRYSTREALVGHMGETHGGNAERIGQVQSEKIKEASSCKEYCSQNLREKMNISSIRERISEEKESEDQDDSRRSDSSRTKLIATREPIDNPASPEFDSSFYSNVSCNIRENLLHHLDGKLQTMSGPSSSTCALPIAISGTTAVATTESKSPQQQPQQSYYEHSVNQIQFPIDISLTAATPVYTKDYLASEEYENSSEYARKAGKTSSGSRPRRVSFEKYNFPRKYDGREQWTCSIKDLSKFDISTQLSLRKKQQLIKERLTISRLHQIPLLSCKTTEVSLRDQERIEPVETAASNQDNTDASCVVDADAATLDVVCDLSEPLPSETKKETTTESFVTSTSSSSSTIITEFSFEFADFMRLRRHEEGDSELANAQKIVYAELSGEWSRTRIYICGACGSRHVTLKEMEDHKASTHPRVLCSHFDLAGDQREYYKHLYLPGRDAPTDAARNATLAEMVCSKCAKSCPNVGELHRHMLECGGDQAWLLGLTGSGKKKCKWRPFGSRSRRRRQRGMKRNIQNSQTQPRVVNVERPKEKQASTGPRVRPSDRESIQKMLANLPAKRATRKVLQDSMMRSQGRLRNVQTRTRPRIGDNSCRISRNKAALRNKLLKNAKSIQRNRCRSDNITAVIESVVRKCHEIEKKSDSDDDKSTETKDESKKDAKEINEGSSKATKTSDQNDRTRPRVVGRPKVLGKKRNVKNPQLQSKKGNKLAKAMGKFVKFKSGTTSGMKSDGEETSSPKSTPKNIKTTSRAVDKDDVSFDSKKMSTISGIKNKNKSTQGILKRKRTVDPVASLNASIKAKSQLRTHDGKFARNPNKNLPAKSSETKTDDGKHKAADSIEIKPKPKAMQKLRKAEIQLPRRVTRLSSDSDKMPTLEPVVQIVSSNEEYADKSANDLPILSPVTSSGSPQDQKTSRISTKCVLKEKENNVETNADFEAVPEKSKKEQKSTRGRRPKETTKSMAKQKKTTVEENKVSKNNVAVLKDDRTKRRKSLPVISTNSGENSKEEMSKGETIAKRDSRSKKEEITKETRSNSKTRVDKDSVKSFEVKKLLLSATMMFGLDMLELVSNDSKRNLRQSMPSSEMLQINDKNPQEFDDELEGSKDTSKKEKIEATRKSSRKNVEKKSDDKMAKTNLEKDSASNATANATQNEKNQQGKRDKIVKAKEIVVDNSDVEDKTDVRQTKESLSDAKNTPSLEITSDNFRKDSGLLRKRRNCYRSVEDEEINTRASEEQNRENISSDEEELEKSLKEFEKFVNKACKKRTEGEGDKNSDDRTQNEKNQQGKRDKIVKAKEIVVANSDVEDKTDVRQTRESLSDAKSTPSLEITSDNFRKGSGLLRKRRNCYRSVEDEEINTRASEEQNRENISSDEEELEKSLKEFEKFVNKACKKRTEGEGDKNSDDRTQNEKNQQGKRDKIVKAKEIVVDNSDVEDKTDVRQTRESLSDAKSTPSLEITSDNFRKGSGLLRKRRNRYRSVEDEEINTRASEEQNSENISSDEEELEKSLKELEKFVNKVCKKRTEGEGDKNSDDRTQNKKNQQGKRDKIVKAKEIMVDNSDVEDKTDVRQTRESLSDAKNTPSLEITSDNFRKGSGLLRKRRNRYRSVEDEEINTRASEEQNRENISSDEEELEKSLKEFEKFVNKACKKRTEGEGDKNSDDRTQNEKNQQGKRDKIVKAKEIVVDNSDVEDKTDVRQTRESLSDAKSTPSLEITSDNFRKGSGLLKKRRNRYRSVEDEEINTRASEEQNSENISSDEEELEKSLKELEKFVNKVCKKRTEGEGDKNSDDRTQNEKNQQGKRDKIVKAKEIVVDNSDVEDKTDVRQTRESLSDAKNTPSLEITSDNFRKGSGLLRKGCNRYRSVEDEEIDTRASEEQNRENISSDEEELEKSLERLEKIVNKACKKRTEGEGDKNSDDRLDSTAVNINLSHLQSETSNLSVDSGKENSLETSVNIHSKLKVGRPRKTWGARREKSSRKRSLNNVIGILTEGMNIPLEAQQSVQVLTVQTSLDNPDRVARNGSSQQTNGGEGNVIAVDSTFSELSVLAKNEEESAENEAVTATSTTDGLQADDNKIARACPDEAQVENAFADRKVDVSSKVATAKMCSPANDIILDLSRRKPKGKGSFLEKIVSKIAKQKDALLEGEVGSLLDTAADELTSILDEVGPTLADNVENANSNKANHSSKNNDKIMTVTSTDEKLPTIVNPEIRALENDKTNVENAVFKRSMDSLETSDNLEESLGTKTETQSENQTKVDNVLDVEMKNYDVDKKVNDAMHSAEEPHIESCESKLIINKEAVIPIEILDENPASLIGKENLEKLERKEGVVKSRRKSSKRSLEDANCSKRSKKRSLEIVEDHVKDTAQKEIQLNDIVTFKSKEASDVGNEFSKKDNSIMETSNADTKVEKIHHSKSETKDDLKPSSLEKNLTKESNDESNLEKVTDLLEAACENVKLTMSLEELSLNKIIPEDAIVTNVQSTESIEKSADFLTLSSEKSVKCGKSVDKIQKKDKTDMSGLSSRRTSKRKSQPILSVTPSIDTATNILQTSVKPIETEEEPSSSSTVKEQSLESIDMQTREIGTTSENSEVPLEKILYSVETMSGKHKMTQNTDNSGLVNSTSSKTTKKRGAKKKSLANEHLELPEDKLEVAPKLYNESSIADSNKQLSVSLEHFKIPEVKDLPQSAKKRGSKKKSQLEDGRWNGGSVSEESRMNEESAEVSNLIEEKVEEQEEMDKFVMKKESSTKKLERSSSSGLIGLISSSTKTRSMFKKKTQLSSEDLANSSIRNQGAESTDDLSESSCVSESSYFRKKRFAKKKKKEETLVDDSARADASCADSTVLKSDKQNLKRKTGKSKSLLDEHLDLSDADDIDIPMDIQASLENTEALENIERELELAEKSFNLQSEGADKPITDDTADKDSYATLEQPASNNHDSPDNPVTPKKRAAGNFVVVHTKSGEILIVEKRKKLTKEAARFFCDVCATSFTRKSSLKKHTLSQSHLSQLTKSTKDKIEPINSNTENAEEDDNEWKSNQENDQQTKSVSDDAQPHETSRKSLEPDENYVSYVASTESTKSLVDFGTTRQMLEDKLLDEEICKITENMSHDEYVLTDHITPEELESLATPIRPVPKKQEDSGRGKNGDKKRNKSKKKNLAEEHLLLDSPELETKIDELPKSTNDVVRVSLSSCDYTSAKEKIEKIEDVSEECVNIAETKNQSELIVNFLNEETDCSKSICDIDAKTEQQTESTRTTRRTRKLSKMDNEGKEETLTLTETNRFSLRPRRNKNIQHYEEFDVEADVYFMDTSIEINSDEIENNCDAQKRQNEVEEETNRNAPQEKMHADIKSSQDAEIAKLKTDSMNDAKKRKRGRPRTKDRIIPNSSIASTHAKSEVNGNDAVAVDNLDESKIKDQKLDLHTKERLDGTGKAPHIDAQPPKRRGRPRKNLISNNSSVQADNSSASESTKSNDDEVKEKTDVIESCSETIEEIVSSSSLIPNAESSPIVQNHTPESSLLETKKNLLNAEEVRSIKLSISEDQPAQRIESTDIKTGDIVLADNCENTLTSNIPSEKDEVEILMPLENTCVDDTECMLENKRNDDTSVNVLTTESLTELPSQITEQVSIDDLRSVESKAVELNNDESFNVQKLPDMSEEKQTKLEEELPKEEEEALETKLSSGAEDSENEVLITNDKSLSIAISQESQKTIDDLENDSICDERATRLESSSKKLSRKSTSKERETDRKRLKASKSKKKKVKVAELSSDSENEDDRIESAASSKSKIVKSVFGRVFGGEKADKVKEVLNDWVSRSEDDSDMSRSASEARSYLRGSTKFSENGHKKEKKCHLGSETKKDIERSPRKKGNDKCGSAEVHGKAKNRKKREKDVELIPEDRIGSPINPAKRRYRESKIRADEKILRMTTFDDESPTLSDEYGEIKKMEDQINNESNDKDKELKRYHEKELNKEQTKNKNLTSENWESLRIDHDAHGKLKNSSGSRRKQDANERSSSPSQSNVFKYRRRESKTRAGERIWRAFDNEILSCLSDDQYLDETHGISNEQESEFYESQDLNRPDNLKSIKQKDDDVWKNVSSIDQEQTGVHSGRGKPRKDSNNRKKQDFNVIRISKTKTKRIPRDSDNESSILSRDQEMKNETQNDQIRSTSESRNRSKTLIKDSACESFVYNDSVVSKHMNKDQDNSLAHWSTGSRKKGIINEDWKRSSRKLEFDQEDDQPIEKEIRRQDEESTISSRSCSSLAAEGPVMKNQLIDLDGNSQTNRKSDDNDNDEEEEEDDNDLGRQRMSPFYARETPDSSIESSSNEEEEEEEEEEGGEEEEEEEERITHEDNSRKTNPSEFSGEKIIIRSPSLGHRSDVVTIAPTDAIEDNALDVPREIESIAKPRQGKILNFDEELFVECCSRLKATSENELRGAKKIKLDHTESYHRRDDQPQGFRVNRDRWRDVESQNSLGSLLESVNQLLGEEMYNSHDRSYRTRGSERSSRSASPDASRIDNLGYEDSLDVAFEHNNKLRDKIQQRMRESENLIASTFGQKINDNDHPDDDKRDSVGNSYSSSIHEHEQLSTSVASNREQESSPGHKNKMNSTLGGLHKALSNLLHSNGKHDHNGSTPMKLLAELACARAPTSTSPEDTTNSSRNHQSVKMVAAAVAAAAAAAAAAAVAGKDTPISPKRPTKDSAVTPKNSPTKKMRNPIKELFERKKEMNDRKEQERSKTTLVEVNVPKQRKSKKNKKQQEFPLIRRNEHYGGLVEKKKRRDSLDRKGDSERIKDVYEFDEEESQMAPTLGSTLSYRSQVDKSYETNWSRMKNIDGDLDTVLENGKTNYVTDSKMDTINRKFQELEKFAPKTKGALKSFQSEEQQQRVAESITGPMDEFVERKQQRIKRPMEQGIKQSGKIKKRGKSSKKRVRNAWYENDSSDEFRTAAKAEDVGVGISKSQRSCSKGKQNLFAELSTSSESEYERDDVDYAIANEQCPSKSRKILKKSLDVDVDEADDQRIVNEPEFDNEDQIANNWNQVVQEEATKNDHDAKSESEMSDHSLVIDERKLTDEARNSDDDADNQYERTFELDDLYREDSSDAESEVEENEELTTEEAKNKARTQALDENATLQTKLTSTNTKDDCAPENELISLEEALDLLDQHEDLDPEAKNNIVNGIVDEASNDGIDEEMENKCLSPTEMRDEKEEPEDDVPALPEKLSSNEKPQKESDHNLPLHVFLSRKVQESKKRKQQQLDKLREEQERILMDFQPTRRQRKCAIGKQGLLAEISSSDEESYVRDNSRKGTDHDKSRKKRESKEKRKERYLEKKHEQMIAKEQKAIEEEILREVGKRKEILAHDVDDATLNIDAVETVGSGQTQKKKHQTKEKHKKSGDENTEENAMYISQSCLDSSEENHNKSDRSFSAESTTENNDHHSSTSAKRKKLSKSPAKSKKVSKPENGKIPTSKRSKEPAAEKAKKTTANNKDTKERRSSSGKRDSDDEELKTTKSWNKVEEGVGVAIGRRKRTAALQLYYWSSSSDEEEAPEPIPAPEEEEDDRQEQHGWIVGDSHKRMITMLAMEKQLKEKRRRSEDEFEPGKAKSKKHRNSTS